MSPRAAAQVTNSSYSTMLLKFLGREGITMDEPANQLSQAEHLINFSSAHIERTPGPLFGMLEPSVIRTNANYTAHALWIL